MRLLVFAATILVLSIGMSLGAFWVIDRAQCAPMGMRYHAHQGCR